MNSINPAVKSLLGSNFVYYGNFIFSTIATGEDRISLNGTDGTNTSEIVIKKEESFSFNEEND